MGHELRRGRADYSTSADTAARGPPRYLIVALDTVAQHGAAVGVDIRMAGSAQIYGNDL